MEEILPWGVFLLMCGIFVLCIMALAVLGLVIWKDRREQEGQKKAVAGLNDGVNKMDSAILKQWNNLLGYNGDEGDEIDG